MKPAQLLLAYQRLVERDRELRDEIERGEPLLTANPDVVAARGAVEEAGGEGGREGVWGEGRVPAQNAYLRVRGHPPVAEVARNQCQACYVTVTSSGMQLLRKGDEIVLCENCSRILVMS